MPTTSNAAAPEELDARAAGLTYASDAEPGIRRKAKGTGFSYILPSGKAVTDKEMLKRIRSLGVPPAWVDVWICPSAEGHVQATGRDARGRKQYRYHPDWQEHRDRNKYERILDFAALLPRIREAVAKDMTQRGARREKVLATVVSLLDRTLIRIGNSEYARENGSFGLTTLHARHMAIDGSELRFHFKGKSGKTWRLRVKDRRIAKVARTIQELPGQQLFKYVDEDGIVRSVDSTDVNEYLRTIAGADVSAKDFRTWAGTVLAAMALSAVGPFTSQTQAKMNVRRAIGAVAEKLGNTPTICRKCYVHPEVVTCYLEGSFPTIATSDAGDPSPAALPSEEAAVLRLLKRRLAPSSPRKARARRAPPPSGAQRSKGHSSRELRP
jgi:DNA topoisomerase I